MICITAARILPRIQLIITVIIELIAADSQSVSIYGIGILLLAIIELGIIPFCVLAISTACYLQPFLDLLIRLCLHLKKIIRTCFFVFNVIFKLLIHFRVNLFD